MPDARRNVGRAKVALGASCLFAAGAVGWFWFRGAPLRGVGLGALVLVAGYWEYRRKLGDVRAAARAEADAERRQQRRRK